MKIYTKLLYFKGCVGFFVVLFFLTHSYTPQLNAAGTGFEEQYPLAATWRASFGEPYDSIHEKLCEREMRLLAKDKGASIENTTNVATFQLVGWKKADSTSEVLLECENNDFCFISGKAFNSIVIKDGKVNFTEYEVGERETIAKRIKKPDGKDTLADDIKGLGVLEEDVKRLREIHECMRTYVETYPLSDIRKILCSQTALKKEPTDGLPSGAMKHLYDSEQSIMRCLDVYFAPAPLDFPAYTSLSLHVHTRFDCCRHCLACMHQRAKSPDYWRKNLGGMELKIFVSSRQDYRESIDLSGGKEYYSMRFIGLDEYSHKAIRDEDGALFARGIIFQTAIPFGVQAEIASKLKAAAEDAPAPAGAGAGAGAGAAAAGK